MAAAGPCHTALCIQGLLLSLDRLPASYAIGHDAVSPVTSLLRCLGVCCCCYWAPGVLSGASSAEAPLR